MGKKERDGIDPLHGEPKGERERSKNYLSKEGSGQFLSTQGGRTNTIAPRAWPSVEEMRKRNERKSQTL